MRRMLLILFALSGSYHVSLEAQICRGLAPLPSGQLQATGTGRLAADSRTVMAGLVYDLPARAFAGVELGTTSVEADEKSSLDLAASLGYQLDIGGARLAQLCPIASTSLQVGPNNAFDSGVDRSTFSAEVGITAGTSLRLRPQLSLVPAIAVGVGHRTHQATSSAGVRLLRIAETYGFAHFHAGFVLKENLSIRPSLEIPLGLNGGEAALGLTVGYHFGLGRRAASED